MNRRNNVAEIMGSSFSVIEETFDTIEETVIGAFVEKKSRLLEFSDDEEEDNITQPQFEEEIEEPEVLLHPENEVGDTPLQMLFPRCFECYSIITGEWLKNEESWEAVCGEHDCCNMICDVCCQFNFPLHSKCRRCEIFLCKWHKNNSQLCGRCSMYSDTITAHQRCKLVGDKSSFIRK